MSIFNPCAMQSEVNRNIRNQQPTVANQESLSLMHKQVDVCIFPAEAGFYEFALVSPIVVLGYNDQVHNGAHMLCMPHIACHVFTMLARSKLTAYPAVAHLRCTERSAIMVT